MPAPQHRQAAQQLPALIKACFRFPLARAATFPAKSVGSSRLGARPWVLLNPFGGDLAGQLSRWSSQKTSLHQPAWQFRLVVLPPVRTATSRIAWLPASPHSTSTGNLSLDPYTGSCHSPCCVRNCFCKPSCAKGLAWSYEVYCGGARAVFQYTAWEHIGGADTMEQTPMTSSSHLLRFNGFCQTSSSSLAKHHVLQKMGRA